MSAIPSFLIAVDAFCEARSISEARASTLILNGGGRIGSIRAGTSDIGARRLDEAMLWLSENWPASAVWPVDVPRPRRSPPAAPSPKPSAQHSGAADDAEARA